MNKVKVQITNNQDKVALPSGTKLLIRRCCNAVLALEKFPHSVEISVILVDNNEIKDLNTKFRNKPSETDVLSFPQNENDNFITNQQTGMVMLGDIVVSVPKALEQSELYGHSFRREIAFLCVHSMLHLLGYDHEENGLAALKMREKEEIVLKMLGLPRDASYVLE